MTRLGTVPHINAKPLIYALENGLVEHSFDISYYNPALLSEKMSQVELDIALIPAAEFLRAGNYKVFPYISISSFGPVDSVGLLVKGDIRNISSVSVDHCSRSSTALLRIVLEIFFGIKPEYIKREFGPGYYDDVDAAMVFGDNGLRVLYERPEGYSIYDLGKVWTEKTNLPFVYAVFGIHKDVDLGSNAVSLLESKSKVFDNIDRICRSESGKIGVSYEFCMNYLMNRIRYDLTEPDIEGLVRYSGYLSELGYCNSIKSLDFYKI